MPESDLEFLVRVEDRIVAACSNVLLGQAADARAVEMEPTRQVTLRHRARIIEWHNRPVEMG